MLHPSASPKAMLQLVNSRGGNGIAEPCTTSSRHSSAPKARMFRRRHLRRVTTVLVVLGGYRSCVVGVGAAECTDRFTAPLTPPLHATDLNGIAIPDVCFNQTERAHHVFVIGDWGGIISNKNVQPKPADHRSKLFPAHARAFVLGVDDRAQIRVAEQMRIRARRSLPEYVINVGDNFYWGGIRARCGSPPFQHVETGQWGPIFENVYYGPGLDDKQWLGVLGNHDYGGYMFTMAWDQAIGYTWGGPSSTGRWMTPAQYWSTKVRYSDFSVDYYFVDSNVFDAFKPYEHMGHNICGLEHNHKDASCGPQGPKSVWACPKWFSELWVAQVGWLEERLLSSFAQWQVVVTHFPPDWGKDDWRYLAKYGIDLLVTGHRHSQDVVPANHELNYLGATAWIVSGGGGGITSEGVPSEDGQDDQYGFMDLTLTKDMITIEAISHGGQTRKVVQVTPRTIDPNFREARVSTQPVLPGAEGDGNRDSSGTFRWARRADWCIDAAEEYADGSDGNKQVLRLADCAAGRVNQQTFQVSKGGHIWWVAHPGKCWDVADGASSNGNPIILWDCGKSNPNQIFEVPERDVGIIVWAAHPSKCLGVSQHGRIEIQDCQEDLALQGFLLPFMSEKSVTALNDAADDLLQNFELIGNNLSSEMRPRVDLV